MECDAKDSDLYGVSTVKVKCDARNSDLYSVSTVEVKCDARNSDLYGVSELVSFYSRVLGPKFRKNSLLFHISMWEK